MAFGGGGGGSSTTQSSTHAEYPPEFRPIVTGSANQILALQGRLPLSNFAQFAPGGTAGTSPIQNFMISNMLPGIMGPSPGTQGLLQLPGMVESLIPGILEAGGVSDKDAGRVSLPQFAVPRQGDTVFTGTSQQDVQSRVPEWMRGEVPNIGGWGPSTISTTQPRGPFTSPVEPVGDPMTSNPGELRGLLPESGRSIFDGLLSSGLSPHDAFTAAITQMIGTGGGGAAPGGGGGGTGGGGGGGGPAPAPPIGAP